MEKCEIKIPENSRKKTLTKHEWIKENKTETGKS
jgi:hypothetical protein